MDVNSLKIYIFPIRVDVWISFEFLVFPGIYMLEVASNGLLTPYPILLALCLFTNKWYQLKTKISNNYGLFNDMNK